LHPAEVEAVASDLVDAGLESELCVSGVVLARDDQALAVRSDFDSHRVLDEDQVTDLQGLARDVVVAGASDLLRSLDYELTDHFGSEVQDGPGRNVFLEVGLVWSHADRAVDAFVVLLDDELEGFLQAIHGRLAFVDGQTCQGVADLLGRVLHICT